MTTVRPLSLIAGAFGRGWRQFGFRANPADGFDPYERAPLRREDLANLFELNTCAPLTKAGRLQESEMRERDSMIRIRAALYPTD